MKRVVLPPMPAIAVDSREPPDAAYDFGGRHPIERVAMPTADYSLVGFCGVIAFERKTIDDYVASVTYARERFFRELERLSHFQVRGVVIEASLEEVAAGMYVSQASPQSVIASAFAIMTDFSIPVLFAGDRERAMGFVEWSLCRFWKKQFVRRVDDDEVA